ncbi:MAG: restriction endonuclease subunit S [Aureliella sp.]
MSFARYSKYRETGIEWLEEVPDHWKTVRLKRVATIRYGIGEPPTYYDDGTPLIRATNVHAGRLCEAGMVYVDPSDIPTQRIVWLEAGDIIVVRSGAYTGDSAIIPDDFGRCIAGFDMVVKCHSANPRFVQSALLSSYLKQGQIDLERMRAAQPHLNAEELGACVLTLPSCQEQSSIAMFLDYETAKIDALITEQLRLIELLKEKRQAVISRAVTKGLNAHAPLKHSGIEWLGDVPAHWMTGRIGSLFVECAEPGIDDLPVLSVSIHTGVSDTELDEHDMERKVTRSEDRSKYKRVQPGDLVYNMMRAWQGGFGTVTVPGMVSPAYVVARPRNALETRFVEHLLRTPNAVEQMRRHSQGVTDFRLRLYWDEFKNIRIALPPLHEAAEICRHIAAMENDFARLTSVAKQSITLLQERRLALISAAVTGKIDVRGLSAEEAA